MCLTEQRIKVTEKHISANIFEPKFLKVCVLLDYTVKLSLWLQYLLWKLFPVAKLCRFPFQEKISISLQLTSGVLPSLDNVSLERHERFFLTLLIFSSEKIFLLL